MLFIFSSLFLFPFHQLLLSLYYLLPFLHYHHHHQHSLFSLNILLFISFSLFFVLSQPGELYRILPFSSLSLSSRASFSFLLFRTNTLTQRKPKLLLQPAQKPGRVNNQPNKQKKKRTIPYRLRAFSHRQHFSTPSFWLNFVWFYLFSGGLSHHQYHHQNLFN